MQVSQNMAARKGSTFSDISKQFIVISGMAIVFNIWAVLNYRKRT